MPGAARVGFQNNEHAPVSSRFELSIFIKAHWEEDFQCPDLARPCRLTCSDY